MQAKQGEWGKFWQQVSELVDAYEESGRTGLASRLSVDLLLGMVDVSMCATHPIPAFPDSACHRLASRDCTVHAYITGRAVA